MKISHRVGAFNEHGRDGGFDDERDAIAQGIVLESGLGMGIHDFTRNEATMLILERPAKKIFIKKLRIGQPLWG